MKDETYKFLTQICLSGYCSFPVEYNVPILNKLISICSIIVLLNILPPTISNLGLRDTKRQILSTCNIDVARCPMDHDSVERRKLCMNNYKGCQGGTSYLCGIDTTDNYIVEACQPDFSCQPGTSFQYVVTLNHGQPEAHLECVPCPGDRFEPERTNSSLTSITAGCTYVHVPQDNLSSHLVLFENGTKSKAYLYVCDYKKNYHERNGIVFVDDIPTRSYDCVKKLCPIGFLLHPDGRCIDCETELVPEDNFTCDNRLGKKSLGTASKVASQEKDGTKISVPAIVVPVVIGLALIVVAAVCFVRWRRRRANVYDRANDREDPPEEPHNNNNENEQHTAETHSNNTNNVSPHISHSTIGTTFQGITHLEYHVHNGSVNTTLNKATTENSDDNKSPKVEANTSLKSYIGMQKSEEDLEREALMMQNLKL